MIVIPFKHIFASDSINDPVTEKMFAVKSQNDLTDVNFSLIDRSVTYLISLFDQRENRLAARRG